MKNEINVWRNLFSPIITRSKTLRTIALAVILLLGASATSFAADANALQGKNITGKVTDSNGSTLPGVTVVEKGTTNGTITDIDGLYSITIKEENDILVFSFVGMESQEITVAGRSVVNISLNADMSDIGEVVVVGYGVQRKEAVTGSVASIDGDLMRTVPSANITQALQGRLPGVQMSQTSSQPGAEMQIRIRGVRSLSADNNPLVVLDGIPFAGTIGDINPSDIKSIDVLKDASATAIYGSRGANGVILLTTYKGQSGSKAKVSYDVYSGFKKAIKIPMMNGPEFIALREAAGKYESNGEDEFADVDTDWQDLFYRTAKVTKHDLSISGGTEQGSYSMGVGYYQDQAVIPTQQYSRISMRVSIDQGVGEYIKVGLSTNSNYNLTEGSQVGMYGILSLSPIVDPYNEDGTWKRTVKMPLDESWIYPRDVVNDLSDRWLNEKRGYGTYNNFYGEVKIPGIEGLKYRANIGLNMRTGNNGSFTGEGINSTNPTNESAASVENSVKTNWVIENLLTYDRTFDDKHTLNVVGLYSAEETKYNKSYMSARNIPEEGFQFYNLGHAAGDITVDPNNQDYWKTGLVSWMGRAMYSFDNRYMLTVTVRSDASSRLAEGYKWHTYPAVSAGWNIGNESFMKDIKAINMLKLRVGYGQTSNQAVAPYATLGRLTTTPYNFGDDVYATGAYVTDLPNPNLGWEYSETLNYGLDFSVLNHRLSGTFEYYVTNTKDLLLSLSLPTTSGVGGFTGNIGETQNKGVEMSLNGLIIDDYNGWSWDAGINLYANRNELIALASGQEQDVANGWFVGHPINVIYDYEMIGLWQEEDVNMRKYESSAAPGAIRVKYDGEFDEEGIPVRRIGTDDRQIMHLDAKFQGGFNTRLAYKGLDLSIVGAFQGGGILISTLYGSSGYLNLESGRRNNVKIDYWTPENTGARYPNPAGPTSGDNPKYGSSLGYFDATYMKIRTISLGYYIDQKWTKNAGIEKLRIYCTVQNPLVMFSSYNKASGLDPETNSYGDENSAVSAYKRDILIVGANTPSTHNFLFGINLTF
ncbi:MAG: SusC/RagA family TonB-linked outer membrane protein [Prolixibacteraceae bacterium]